MHQAGLARPNHEEQSEARSIIWEFGERAHECDPVATVVSREKAPQSGHTAHRTVLWEVPCPDGSDNSFTSYMGIGWMTCSRSRARDMWAVGRELWEICAWWACGASYARARNTRIRIHRVVRES